MLDEVVEAEARNETDSAKAAEIKKETKESVKTGQKTKVKDPQFETCQWERVTPKQDKLSTTESSAAFSIDQESLPLVKSDGEQVCKWLPCDWVQLGLIIDQMLKPQGCESNLV